MKFIKILFMTLFLSAGICLAEDATVIDKIGKGLGDTLSAVGNSIAGTVKYVAGDIDPAEARKEVDAATRNTLDKLIINNKKAHTLYDIAYGYAVFDSRKFSFLLSTGSGTGVAVEKESGQRTYMHMAKAGANLGAGVQYFDLVFFFEDKKSFDQFVDVGLEAGASLSAGYGEDSLNKDARFIEGLAVFKVVETGIMAGVDLTGTKYWKSKELNQQG